MDVFSLVLVPGRGLEPLRIAPPDPKSGASANFATLVKGFSHSSTNSRASDRRGKPARGLFFGVITKGGFKNRFGVVAALQERRAYLLAAMIRRSSSFALLRRDRQTAATEILKPLPVIMAIPASSIWPCPVLRLPDAP